IQNHQQSLDIKSRILYSMHPEIAKTRCYLARDFFLDGRQEAVASDHVTKAIDVLNSTGIRKDLLMECLILRANIKWKLRYFPDAVSDLRKAIEICSELGGYNFATSKPDFFAKWTNPLITLMEWQLDKPKLDANLAMTVDDLASLKRRSYWSESA